MQKYPIVVLVGTSGAGKTALLLEMLKRFPDVCAPIKSKTTRARRNDQDDIFYDFVSLPEFEKLVSDGRIFQQANFGGNHYGCDRLPTDAAVANKLGLVVLVQTSVPDFENAGYKMQLVHVVPDGHVPRNDPKRQQDDAARELIPLSYDHTLINSFAPGGFEKAATSLAAIVQSLLNQSPPNA